MKIFFSHFSATIRSNMFNNCLRQTKVVPHLKYNTEAFCITHILKICRLLELHLQILITSLLTTWSNHGTGLLCSNAAPPLGWDHISWQYIPTEWATKIIYCRVCTFMSSELWRSNTTVYPHTTFTAFYSVIGDCLQKFTMSDHAPLWAHMDRACNIWTVAICRILSPGIKMRWNDS